jgi:hypothetical protein
MSFVRNSSQQITLDDALSSLTAREQRMLEKSWAKEFAEHIFPMIDEKPFAVLYSDKASRPNTPVNVIIGALMIKELLDLTDDEILEAMMFDIRFQYALHTTSFEEQPLSDRSLSRFRNRCYTYEVATGKDLIHDCVTGLSGAVARLMKINAGLWRTDSLMVASNIKRLSRLELLYTCVANLVDYLHKQKEDEKLSGLEHYVDPADYNRTVYHNRSTGTEERLKIILGDADKLLSICNGGYDEVSEYQLLVRAIREQTIRKEDGTLRMKTQEDGEMRSDMLQNPSDPDATYREKSKKQHRGYVANVVESVGETGSIITDYQYDQNTHSDSRFLKKTVNALGKQEEESTLVADGAYSGAENVSAAKEKNINLITTDLTGRDTKEIFAEFEFSEDGSEVLTCAAGHKPRSCSKARGNAQCRVSFNRGLCENCPHKDECQPKMFNKTTVLHLSAKSVARARAQLQIKTVEFKQMQRMRNGVESIPSILRRKYDVDHMPVRGKIRTKLWFGFKIAALNAKKLFNYLVRRDKCAQIMAIA